MANSSSVSEIGFITADSKVVIALVFADGQFDADTLGWRFCNVCRICWFCCWLVATISIIGCKFVGVAAYCEGAFTEDGI